MYPERVSSLVLAMAGCPGVRSPDPALQSVLELVGEYWTTGLVANMLVQHPPDRDEAIAQLARFERYCCTPSVAVEILRRGAESDLRPFLEHIKAPTLVVNQRGDPIIPAAQWIDYPALIGEPIRIQAVRPELLVAWKLDGFFDHGPKRWLAKGWPRRPKPVITSSKTSRMPCFEQISRRRCR